ncbi:MAG: hypothetical protein QOJ12_220 [Thermoleophilales bacterium]|jgi:hypothetical protein|nr:hypothetical protein [Thermoleophilales bacterium]
MFDGMTPQITYIAATLSGVEQASLAAVAVGLVGLIAARLIAGDGGITRRAYGKVYGGAPGANVESKPEA